MIDEPPMVFRMKAFARICICMSALFFVLPAHPQERATQQQLDEIWRVYRDAAMRTWRMRLLPEFAKAANPELRRRLMGIGFRVIRFADFNAFANYDAQEIHIPVGLVMVLDTYADAFVLTWKRPQCKKSLSEFPGRLTDAYFKQLRGQKVVAPDFARSCGLSAAEAGRIRNDRDSYALKATMIVDSLSLVVGHEIGHLVLGHKPSRTVPVAESQRQEHAADAFGLKLATDAGFSPGIAASTTFPMFALMESEDGATGRGAHPPVACRMDRIITAFIASADSDQASKGLEHMGMSKGDFDRSFTAVKQACQDAENGGR